MSTMWRSRWAAVGAAVAVTLGAGGIGLVNAEISSGDRPVTITIEPERVLDTRVNLGLAGRFADSTPRDIKVTGSVPVASGGSKVVVPDTATAVLVNATVLGSTSKGFMSLRPAGAAGSPTTSTVNFTTGTVEPNAATVDIGPGGAIQIWVETDAVAGSADVLLDIVGYTEGHNHDDRYYTEAEINAKTMFAVVNANGTLRRGTTGVTSQLFPGGFTGDYSVRFPRSVAECGWTVSVTATTDGNNPVKGFAGVTVQSGSMDTLYVQGNNTAGTATEVPFTVIVNCP